MDGVVEPTGKYLWRVSDRDNDFLQPGINTRSKKAKDKNKNNNIC